MGKALMVWGCTSDAGKSLITAALCRWFSDHGWKTAPYKAQNMSNNARVAEGGEMGCAQHFQALAARRVPDVRMNPVLLKPERDTASQVVVMGQVDREIARLDWRSRSGHLWERARTPLRELLAENDLVILEGAGSPAEINLASCDYVNLSAAREAGAVCLLVSDIDRGGSFAHLYGTWAMLPEDLRGAVKGFVLNKFRGDASLLSPGPQMLAERTGVPVVGVVPRVEHGLPDEDAVALDHFPSPVGEVRFEVRVVAWPRISNFDEFRRLAQWPGVRLAPARSPEDLRGADLVIVPGSKNTPSDLAWMRGRGIDRVLADLAAAGKPVLGVCGGLQALGATIEDPAGVEGEAEGLGLLPLRTVHDPRKRVERTCARVPTLDGFWAPLSGLEVRGYEIRTGSSTDGSGEGLFFQRGSVLGTYLHGLLEDGDVLTRLFGPDPDGVDPLEKTFDDLSSLLDRCLDMATISSWIDPPSGGTSDARPAASSVPATGASRLCVLTGGVRSGKSREAERLASSWGGDSVSFLATAQGLDEEMRERIGKHRRDRDGRWETVEEPLDVASALRRCTRRVVLLDCVTLLVSNLLLAGGSDAVRSGIEDLLAAWRESGRDLVVVTNEVGLGIVPDNALSREYRDQLGWANQRLVEASTEAWMMVAGRKLSLS